MTLEIWVFLLLFFLTQEGKDMLNNSILEEKIDEYISRILEKDEITHDDYKILCEEVRRIEEKDSKEQMNNIMSAMMAKPIQP